MIFEHFPTVLGSGSTFKHSKAAPALVKAEKNMGADRILTRIDEKKRLFVGIGGLHKAPHKRKQVFEHV